jgi:hypothetical protein
VSNLSEWLPNYKVVVGDFTDPHPTFDSLTADLPFVSKEEREGRSYNIPVVVSPEQGQTADVSGDAFAIRGARNSVMKEATVNGASLLYHARIPYDAMLRSRNGTGNKKQGNAFKDAFLLKTKMLMEQGEHYNEIAMHYGPGTGATIADDIGVIGPSGGSGSALNSGGGLVLPITIATWAPGVWSRLQNGLFDLYNSAGNTLIANNLTLSAVNPDYAPAGSPIAPNVTLTATTSGPDTTTTGASSNLAACYGGRLLPAGWAQKSCIGVVSRFKNQGIQDGINAATYAIWRPVQISVSSGSMTRLRIQSIAARMYSLGLTQGLTMRCCGPIFADLAEETELQREYTDSGEVRKVSATKLIYRTPAGPFSVKLDAMMKYGTVIGYGSQAKGKRVGSSPLTFRGKGDEWFFTELAGNAGSEIRCMANQSPFFDEPNKCFVVTGLTPNALI